MEVKGPKASKKREAGRIPPRDVAEMMLQGVKHNAAWVATHPDLKVSHKIISRGSWHPMIGKELYIASSHKFFEVVYTVEPCYKNTIGTSKS
jgi:hypothetical protein